MEEKDTRKGKYVIKNLLDRGDIRHNLENNPQFVSPGLMGYFSERTNPINDGRYFHCKGPEVLARIVDNHYVLFSTHGFFNGSLPPHGVFGIEEIDIDKNSLKSRLLEKLFSLCHKEMQHHSKHEYEFIFKIDRETMLGDLVYNKDNALDFSDFYKKILEQDK
ncbi:MAG: hypothetical protein KC516_03060 [Nanoarchaeota archaeon]|nr:hypothetical protein [Nanoarchaeota archaeon]